VLTTYHTAVQLSLLSPNSPISSVIETGATLYCKGAEQFDLLLTEPCIFETLPGSESTPSNLSPTPRLLWLELSPYRLKMTMQGNGQMSYRHVWERGTYGISRYWLYPDLDSSCLQLRNFTRRYTFEGFPLPNHIQLEYELWSTQLRLGLHVLELQIQHGHN
jgi:hypothetical protein